MDMRKKEVLRGKKDFGRLYKRGKSVADRYIVVIFLENKLPYTRTAVLASKKVGNSVTRNRAKRLIKESLRSINGEIAPGYDLILIARNSITGRKCTEVEDSLRRGLKKANLIG